MKYLLPLLLLAGVTNAATVTVNVTAPTLNTDGTAIPATGPGSLTSVRIEYGTCNGTAFGTKAGEVTRTMPLTSTTLNLNPGTTCIRAFISNTYGAEADASNVVTVTVKPPTPQPAQLTVVATTVYDVRPNETTFAFDRGMKVGTIKLGAACDESRHTDADWYALERPSYAVLTKAARSRALVARCGSASSSGSAQGG